MVFFVQLCRTIRIITIKWIVGTKCFVAVRFDITRFFSSESELLLFIINIITITNNLLFIINIITISNNLAKNSI